jgi:Acetyltransferase (GNAT) domain
MIEIVKYESSYKSRWDDFVSNSKNGSFLFYRDYMEYHSDRFLDSSLMFFDKDLIAVMPANVAGDFLYSHQGLTYGGIVTGYDMKLRVMLDLFDALMGHLKEHQVKTFIYKTVPHIYHLIPAEEDLYALFRHNAKLVRRDASAAIFLHERIAFSKGRKRGVKRGKSKKLTVKRTNDFGTFMSIAKDILSRKYDTTPTHTAREIESLATRFPEKIKLFAAYQDETMLAGVIMYETTRVAHIQYIFSTEHEQKVSAGEVILDYLLNDYYARRDKQYFDFGISTEQGGWHLNRGLIAYKEGFGARATMYDTYEVDSGNIR